MTTGGEGGIVTTNDESLWRRMWEFKDHGKSYEAVYERQHPLGFRWLHESFGSNWRMLEMQATIGRIQLRRLVEWTVRRQTNAAMLSATLQPFSGQSGPMRLPQQGCSGCTLGCGFDSRKSNAKSATGCVHAQYKFYAYIRPENLAPGWNRDRIIEVINAEGVPCYQGSCSEVYLEKAFDATGWRPGNRLPVAQQLGETSIMLLVHPTLTQFDMIKTVKTLQKVLSEAQA